MADQSERIKRRKLSNNSWKETTWDGCIQTTTAFQAHENKLYVETKQPGRNAVLEDNKRLRSLSRDHTTLRRGLSIPEEDFGTVCERYPLLLKGTPDEKKQAMSQIMAAWPEYVIIEHTPKYFSVPGGING